MAELKNTIVNGVLNVNGDLIASTIIKRGGTSSQVLMADGSTSDKSSVGVDTGVTTVSISGSGNAVTSASISSNTRTLTLTKGVSFLTLDTDQTVTGVKTFNAAPTISTSTFGALNIQRSGSSNGASIKFINGTTATALGYIGMNKADDRLIRWTADSSASYTIWDSGNDGSGSGLDADLLDGKQGSYYLNYNNFTNKPSIPVPTNYYWANVKVASSSSTATSPSFQKMGITGSTSSSAAAAITMEYDSTYKALKFVFA